MPRQSLVEYLDDFSQKGQDVAYVQRRGYRTERWTYQRVAAAACQFARELESRDVGKGECVLIRGQDSAEWVVAFLGCILRGAIAVPIDAAATDDFTLRVFKQVNAKLLVCSSQYMDAAVPAFCLESPSESTSAKSFQPYTPFAAQLSDVVEIVFTSGTTSQPKGIVITHGNFLANLEPIENEVRKYLKYERVAHPIRFLNLVPLSHLFGQLLGIFLPQLVGGTVVFQDSSKPTDVIAAIRRERVSVLVSVPRMLQSLKEKLERDLENEGLLPDLRRRQQSAQGQHFFRRWWTFRRIHRQFGWKFWALICGGATLDSATEEFWKLIGYAVIQGYGLTETTSLITLNHPFRPGKGSVGKILPGREAKLGPDGEILVRGEAVAAYYQTAPDEPSISQEDGWFHTGDIGALDQNGNLYFKGRKKDVIVTPAGMNVYPEDLEEALRRQPEIKDCVVVGLPRDGNAEPCAALILREKTAKPEEAVHRANNSLAEYQRVRSWMVWPEHDFPRTSTQKPRRNVIHDTVVASLANKSLPVNSAPLVDLVAAITRRPVAADAGLNLSSLDRVALLGALEDRYQLDLSESNIANLNTMADVEALVSGTAPHSAQFHYPRWAQMWPVSSIRIAVHYLFLRPVVWLLTRPQIQGRENLRGLHSPALVVCNHVSDFDVAFVIAALPSRFSHKLTVATAGETLEALRNPRPELSWTRRVYDRIKWLLGSALLNLFPMPQRAGFRESFAFAGESADRGYSVLVFPEGRHTSDGRLGPFMAGIGLLATNLGLPVVPIRIDGLFEVSRAGKLFTAPGTIRVNIRQPLRFGPESPQRIAGELREVLERS
ncbi:MAG: AMP-binding protein [Acidobacteriales bacterium]|nr:AMP-binding protein [Terriglobales bacterium]